MHRRHFLQSAAVITLPLATLSSQKAHAQATARIVVGFAPGGTADVFARLFAEFAARHLNHPVIVENRPGASAIIGAETVARAAPDGNTIFLSFADAICGSPALYRKLPYQPATDFAPIAQLAQGPLVVAANKDVPAKNLTEFVNYAKRKDLSWGSWGAGSHGHLLCEALNRAHGLSMQHVAYKGEAPALQALLSGEIQVMAASIGGMLPHLRAEKVRALGTNGRMRSLALPLVPTLLEAGAAPGEQADAFALVGWVGLFAPARTPPPQISRWSDALKTFLAGEPAQQRILLYGFEPKHLGPQAFTDKTRADTAMWAKLIRQAGVTLD
jgi:tripartite-type tricarboxylate transporter receptor subunit TctC